VLMPVAFQALSDFVRAITLIKVVIKRIIL
jgi:hypothetical protein